MRFRAAVENDLPALVALLAADPLGSDREDSSATLPGSTRDAFAAIEADENHLLLVAEVDGRPAGLLQLTTDKRRPDALRFYERLGFTASHEGLKLQLRD